MFNLHTHTTGKNRLLSCSKITHFSQSLGLPPSQYDNDFNLPDNLPQNILAIGECGLDRSIKTVPMEVQKKLFQSHIDLAQKEKLPLIVHCVKAYNDIMNILKEKNFKEPIIFHAYNGNIAQTESLIKRDNTYFSIGHLILQKSKISSSINKIPLTKIFCETDTHPDEYLELIYKEVAKQKQLGYQQLVKQIEQNRKKIWGEKFSVE